MKKSFEAHVQMLPKFVRGKTEEQFFKQFHDYSILKALFYTEKVCKSKESYAIMFEF